MVDLYLLGRKFFDEEDFYNYYDIDADKIFLYKKSDNEYVFRYNDVNKCRQNVEKYGIRLLNY